MSGAFYTTAARESEVINGAWIPASRGDDVIKERVSE